MTSLTLYCLEGKLLVDAKDSSVEAMFRLCNSKVWMTKTAFAFQAKKGKKCAKQFDMCTICQKPFLPQVSLVSFHG